jgi:hypothetical protein
MNDSKLTSALWWEETKNDNEKLHAWLQRQYIGEFAAVHLLTTILIRYGSDMAEDYRQNIAKVAQQEILHGMWVSELLSARGVKPEVDADATRRYWNDVLPAVKDFHTAMQAAEQAEHMRLFRIRTIAEDVSAPDDIRRVFQKILPHEEWHERVFGEMRGDYFDAELASAHGRGLASLQLVLA